MLELDINLETKKLKNYLENSKKILLINHRRMDGDAYGSLRAFYYILSSIGDYDVFVINDEKTPENFSFLNDEEIFNPTLDLKTLNPDLIISFDVATTEQFGDIYKNNLDIFLNTTLVNIDHHISNNGFGNINIINTDSSSTCEIVFNLINYLGFEKYINSKIATFLLTGIITDTNSFFNTNSTPESFLIASKLMRYSPKHQDIIINLFKKKPYNRLKLWGNILESLKNINDSKIVWNTIPKSIFIQTGTTDKDISGLIDEFLTTIDGLEVGFLLYEIDNKKIKGSFRGKTDNINLSKFCEKWGGGGHSRASGFVIEGKNLFEIEQEVIEELTKIVK